MGQDIRQGHAAKELFGKAEQDLSWWHVKFDVAVTSAPGTAPLLSPVSPGLWLFNWRPKPAVREKWKTREAGKMDGQS